MLNATFLLPAFLRFLRLANQFGCFGFKWDAAKGRLVLLESRTEIYYHKACVVVYALLANVSCVQTLKSSSPSSQGSTSTTSIAEKCVGTFLAIWFAGFVQSPIYYHLRQEEALKLLNQVIHISKMHEGRWKLPTLLPTLLTHLLRNGSRPKSEAIRPTPTSSTTQSKSTPGAGGAASPLELDLTEKLITIFLLYGYGNLVKVPMVAAAVYVGIVPCQSANPVRWFLPRCSPLLNEWHWSYNILAHIAAYLVKAFMVSFSISFAVLMTTSMLVMSMVIRFQLKSYGEEFYFDREQVAGDRRLATTLEFRKIQLLCEEFNGFHAKHVTGPLMLLLMSTQIAVVHAGIQLAFLANNNTAPPMIALFGFYQLVIIAGHFLIIQSMASISNQSETLLEKLKKARESKSGHRKYYEKFVCSCKPLRVYFGSSNFVERRTPLVSQDFAFNQVVNLLLLK